MTTLRAIVTLALTSFCLCRIHAQPEPELEIHALSDEGLATYDFQTKIVTATNGVRVRYGSAVLTAERVSLNRESYEPSPKAKFASSRRTSSGPANVLFTISRPAR